MPEKKILIADDEEDCRLILQAILEDAGFTVITATDGHEAVEKADRERPDLIILDVVMETYTAGCNAVARLRESPQTKDIPIILATGLDLGTPSPDAPDSEKPMQAQDYIQKPIERDRLLSAVTNLIGAPEKA
jgi:CheY-like chemotaxis protein